MTGRGAALALCALVAGGLGASAGCGGASGGGGGVDAGSPDGPAASGQLQLGSAGQDGTGFVDVTDGQDVSLIPGAQGGFHIWTSLKVTGASGELQLDREARRMSDDALVLSSPGLFVEVPGEAASDWWEMPQALPSFMCPSPVGIQIYDQELSLHARLLDQDGNLLGEDEIHVVPRCPADAVDFCHSICSG